MAYGLIQNTTLQSIADAIRQKNESSDTYKPGEMAAAILGITTGEPDWTELGYEDTPSEILTAFEYSKYIHDNWEELRELGVPKYTNNKKMFLFPNVDITETGLYNAMFEGSNLIHIEPIIIGQESGSGVPNCQTMFKGTLIGEIKISAKNDTQHFNTNNMFNGCANLEKAELNLISDNLQYMFGGCKSLTAVSGNFDTSSATSANTCFEDCNNLVTAPSINLTGTTNCYRMFHNCLELVNVPSYTLTNCTNLQQMFWNCSKLANIGTITIPSATNLTNMFQSTGNSLTETSRDNILQMCVSATAYTGTKTLANLGFANTMYTAASWQALEHYNDFITAGWTIGYS